MTAPIRSAPPEAKIPDTDAYNDLKASTAGRAVGEILRAADELDNGAQHRLMLNVLPVMGIAFAIVISRWTPDVHELPPEDSAGQRSLPGAALSFADILRTRNRTFKPLCSETGAPASPIAIENGGRDIPAAGRHPRR